MVTRVIEVRRALLFLQGTNFPPASQLKNNTENHNVTSIEAKDEIYKKGLMALDSNNL